MSVHIRRVRTQLTYSSMYDLGSRHFWLLFK